MRSPRSPWRRLLPRAIGSLVLAVLSLAAQAQALPGGGQLGMSAQQLREAVPTLERVARPVRMAGGLVGSWRASGMQVGGVAVAPTFFFAAGELKRVEYVADGGTPDAYESLLAWGRSTWGPELASQGSEGAYAAWTTATTQAYLQQAQRGQVRLVVKQFTTKDASEL